jgi:hypothetical protein
MLHSCGLHGSWSIVVIEPESCGDDQIGQGEQHIGLAGALLQPAITNLAVTEAVLDDMEDMLDTRTQLRLEVLDPRSYFFNGPSSMPLSLSSFMAMRKVTSRSVSSLRLSAPV